LKADRLDGFVVPLTDEHMSEYVGSYAQRLAWLTGFQGSAGSAVVLPEEAAIFVDGRYTLAGPRPGRRQSLELPVGAGDQHRRLAQGARARRRPDRLRSLAAHQGVGDQGARCLAEKGAELVAVRRNPIDAVWADQPEPSRARLIVHADATCRQVLAAKRQEMATG
jgi:Xaa-Pro aminopeptidase